MMRYAVILMGIATFTSWASAQEQETIERSFAVSGRAEIRVRNEDGRVHVTPSVGQSVEVRAVKEVHHAADAEEARRLANEVQVNIEESGNGNRIEVTVVHPERSWPHHRRAQVLVNVEIATPSGSDLDIGSEDGPVTIEGIDGRVRVYLEDGDLRLTDVSGNIDVEAEDGDLRLQNIRGEVVVTLEDGDLELTGSLQRLRAETEDGEIDVRLLAGSQMEGEWSLEAEDGGIDLSLPDDFAANLDIRVNDGRISVDDGLEAEAVSDRRRSRRRVVGPINGGGPTLRVRTSDGSVRIRN